MRALRWSVAFAVALASFPVAVRCAHARGREAIADEQRRTVEVVVAGDAGEARLLEDTIRETFARRGLSVVRGGTGAPPETLLARVDVDLGAKDGARFVVADGRTGAVVLEKTMPREAGDASIVREEIALAVRSAVESELLHDDAPPPPPPPPPPELQPVATLPPDRDAGPEKPREPSAVALDIMTFAGAGWVADDTGPVSRIGAGVSVGSRRAFRPSIALTFHYAVPFETSTALLSSHASLFGVRLMPGLELFRTSAVALEVGAGGGVDVLTVEPRSAVLPASTLGSSTTRGDAVLSAAVTARIALVSAVTLTVSAASDVDFATRSYVLDDGGRRSDILALWHLRPALLVGLGFTALGDGPFEAR